MSANGLAQIGFFLLVVLALAKPMGWYMERVFSGEMTWLRKPERFIYRIFGVDEAVEQNWMQYTGSLLAFSLVSVLVTYAMLRLQQWFPWNPQGLGNVGPDLSFNTAVSFGTNTNWQSYTPETTMSYLSQMAALATHNFFSAAVGIAAAIAFVRGFARHSTRLLGNFWVDFTRAILYVLLPLALAGALVLCSQGVIQNLDPYTQVTTLEGGAQTIPQGPVASQEAIKMIGTNGGGFFNANSAHPYENPTPLANFFQMVFIFLIPAGLTYTFGKMVKDTRQGWALLAAMTVLFFVGVCVVYPMEQAGNPVITRLGVAGGNMEGKEVRFGIANSALFTVVTTDASCGAVNNAHDSLTPLGGMVPLINIMLGEIVFGGVGAGLYGMIVYVILAVFIAGLMVGRTPEYLGKKIESYDIKAAAIAVLLMAFSILGFSGWAVLTPWGQAGQSNAGPHGLTEFLCARRSCTATTGSAY